MSSDPLSQWLSFAKASLSICRQAGAAGTAALDHMAGQVPAGQSQCAQFLKTALEIGKGFGELQSDAAFKLLQTQLGMFGAPLSQPSMHGWLGLHFDLMEQCCAQWKATTQGAVTRASACLGDLRQAETRDDLSFVAAGFLRDAETRLRKALEEAGALFNSAGAAAGVLAGRQLDELIASQAAGTAPHADA